jgi:hypothetical protein
MITEHIQLIMVIIGLMTMGSLVFFLAPGVLGKRLLGITEISPGLILLTRHWAFLVSLVGAFLVYAAFDPPCRFPALLMASLEKITFAGLVFLGPFKNFWPAQLAALGDGLLALICLACLVGLLP